MKALLALTSLGLLSACVSNQSQQASPTPQATQGTQPAQSARPTAVQAAAPAANNSNARIVRSRDGSFDGEIVGTVRPGSKFSKVQIGMTLQEVTATIGAYNSHYTTPTGKQWIPFYYGNDAYRWQVSYRGEGCLTFTGGNVFGGGGNQLIMVTVNTTHAVGCE